MDIGTVTGVPGSLTTGELPVTELPTGAQERLPVLVAEGTDAGPTVWITASIHSDEVTGLAVAQDVMTDELASAISGRVVCVPVLNPSGLRRGSRTSYYHGDDPNRSFGTPAGAPPNATSPNAAPPNVQELINRRVYDEIVDTADAVVSLHTSWVGSYPYTIAPRTTYGHHRSESEARDLAADVDGLAEAFGFPVVRQFDRETVLERGLDGALTEALVVEAGIPAITPELGGRFAVDDDLTAAAVEGLQNVFRAFGLLDGAVERVAGAPTAPVDYPVKRAIHPYTDTPGVVRYRLAEGDVVEPGDVVADVVTPHGTHRRTLESEREGYLLSRHEGNVAYENDAVADLAVRDEGSLVVPYDPD